MIRTFFRMAEQIDDFGFYLEIEFEFKLSVEYSGVSIHIDNQYERWRPGILFGAMFFLEHSINKKGIEIKIINILYNEVDTTNTIVAFGVIEAIEKKTNLSLTKKPSFDRVSKVFIFPK
jgi:hypothetical protein